MFEQGRWARATGTAQGRVPAGWPEEVQRPADPDWEASAVEFLLSAGSSGWRSVAALRRHPGVLAEVVAGQVAGQERALDEAINLLRAGWRVRLDPAAITAVMAGLQQEQARLIRLSREVGMVKAALNGEVWLPSL